MKISDRVLSMQASPIRKLMPLAQQAKKRGIHIYHLNIGQPDIETPQVFFDAVTNEKMKILTYALSQGEPELIHSIQEYFLKDDIHFDEDEIIVTNGGSEALIFALTAICDPGDEILVPEPFYTNYSGFVQQTGVIAKPITTYVSKGFHLPPYEELVSLISDKTKAILFSNPGNPTGTVYTIQELETLKRVALDKDIFLISDEVYRKIVFDGEIAPSIGILKGIDDRSIIIESVSKRYSSCGARIGSVQSKNKELMKGILKLAQARLSVSTINQVGATQLYLLDDEYVSSIRDEYQKRRDVVLTELLQIPDIKFQIPKGAFYIIVTLPVKDSEEYVKWMLSEYSYQGETVMLAPAKDFYTNKNFGVNQVRIAYVLESVQLKKAMEIVRYSLIEYAKLEKNG